MRIDFPVVVGEGGDVTVAMDFFFVVVVVVNCFADVVGFCEAIVVVALVAEDKIRSPQFKILKCKSILK